MKIFVTDGDERPALAIVRALGRRGWSVLVGGDRPSSLASSSRHCTRHVTYPSPHHDPAAFDAFVREFVARERVDVVVPVTDVTTYAVARQLDRLSRFTAVAAPPFAAFDFASDKEKLLRHAAARGVPIPRTQFVSHAAGLNGAMAGIEYPAVVKPVRSRIPTDAGWLPATVHYAHDESELRRLYDRADFLRLRPSLIQQRIVGPGVGLFVLFDRGEPAVTFAHRRLREKPPSGGTSVLRESLPVNPRLLERAVRLLGPLRWHGVAMIEFKQDVRSGEFFLMEVNGRFWGSLQLALDAGIDFPYLCCQQARQRPLDVPRDYRVGVKSRWVLGDLDHLLIRLFGGDRDLPPSAPSKLRTLVEFLTSGAPDVYDEVWRRDDPGPGRYEWRQYARALSASAAKFVWRSTVPAGSRDHDRQSLMAAAHQRGKNAGALR